MVTKSGMAAPVINSEAAFFAAATPAQQQAIIKGGFAPPVVHTSPALSAPTEQQSAPAPKQT